MMEGKQTDEAVYLMDNELLPQGKVKLTKDTENIEVRKQNMKMMQGDVGYDLPSPVDPLQWVPEEIESMLKEASEDVDDCGEDQSFPTADKLTEENDVDSQTQSNEDMVQPAEIDVKHGLNVDLISSQADIDDETEIDLDKLMEKEETVCEALIAGDEISTADSLDMNMDNQKLSEELLEDERLVEEVMEKIKLMQQRHEQLSANLEAVAEHAARNEAYMEVIYSRSTEQLEDLLKAITIQLDEESVNEEEEDDEMKEKPEE